MGRITNSRSEGENLAGGAWLCREYGVDPVQPLRYISRIGGATVLTASGGVHQNTFQATYAPKNSLPGHLEFMLRHERIQLELLSRLFEKAGSREIAQWVLREPSGRYSRRAGWLFEWLTGQRLDVPDATNAPYVPALESDRYWTATRVRNVARWRVRDNMPGTRAFCPTVLLDDDGKLQATESDVKFALEELETEFGADLLRRSAVWLTLKESRSSFQIEGERDPSREARFAVAMELYLGRMNDAFGADLMTLQREILGPHALHYGLRQSPIFVGQVVRYKEVVHYVAPRYDMLPEMLDGLRDAAKRTEGSNPLIRAAALSFGYVYLHPLADGNGRVSRFLVNDVLRKDGVVKEPLVLPISATINQDMASYDQVLDVFSAPFRRRYAGAWRFGPDLRYSDGQVSNFEFDAYDDAAHAWRYIDLTDHAAYLAGVLTETIRHEMYGEALHLRKHYRVRESLGRVIEGSDNAIDRIIRSVGENHRITGVLKAEYPILDDSKIADRVLKAVLEASGDPGV